jgi:phage terminase small subunit
MTMTKQKKPSTSAQARKARFAAEYLIDLSATKAAERAGYSPRTAKQQGSRLLTDVDVQRFIAERQARLAKRLELREDVVIGQLLRLAFYDTRKLFDPEDGRLLPITSLDDDTMPGVAGVKVKRLPTGDQIIEVRLATRQGPLELLGKRLKAVDRQSRAWRHRRSVDGDHGGCREVVR